MKALHSSMRRWLFASTAAAMLITAGCNRSSSGTTTNTVAQASARKAETARNTILRTSAEPFEVLTEQAFTAPWPAADRLIADARSAGAAARKVVPAASAAALDTRLAAMETARKVQDRPGLALAAVETYRDLVQAQDAPAQVPIPVSLLDYAGFRYDALAQAPGVDWAAMEQSARFAGEQWRAIEPGITSQAMRGVMPQAIEAMSAAVTERNVPFARSAAATELALVDLLEEQVAARQRGPGR
ncbi:MAG: hypothetical protein JWN69_905 [Alphaproteobacteria bacterium]|nr:hypothetical protein [Alphaproteobacteria bacterium]